MERAQTLDNISPGLLNHGNARDQNEQCQMITIARINILFYLLLFLSFFHSRPDPQGGNESLYALDPVNTDLGSRRDG